MRPLPHPPYIFLIASFDRLGSLYARTLLVLLIHRHHHHHPPSLFLTFYLALQVSVSSAVLKAAAHHYGSQCDGTNKEFMLCRWEEKDPRKCLKEGKAVNQCALEFFRYVSAFFESHAEYLILLLFLPSLR